MLTDITLHVANPEAAIAFYQLLGGSPDNDGSGTLWFGDSAVQLWPGDTTSHIHLSINAENPAAVAATLTAEGHPVSWADKTMRVFTVTDPDGNTVMVRDSACWRH